MVLHAGDVVGVDAVGVRGQVAVDEDVPHGVGKMSDVGDTGQIGIPAACV